MAGLKRAINLGSTFCGAQGEKVDAGTVDITLVLVRKYVDYYHSCRTHLSLEKDAPEPRRVESPAMGRVRAIPKVGGLYHYYTRRAA